MFRSCLLVLATLTLAASAQAATFIVDTTSDAMLADCDDGVAADCSLRGAIALASANPDADTVAFDIPSSDPGYISATAHWRIEVSSGAFPFIQYPLTIDGYTQAGATANTQAPDEGGSNAVLKIEFSGANAWSNGLHGSQMTVRGLAINRFRGGNLNLAGPGPHRIEGCFIGTGITGMTAPGDNASNIGIRVSSGNVVVGGDTPDARNVISGNSYIGISDSGGTSSPPNTYQGNILGLAADGSSLIAGRQDFGIYASDAPQGSLIGGTSIAERNLFGGHGFSAITITGNPLNPPVAPPPTRILGNFIGTDWSGELPRGNGLNPASPSQPYPSVLVGRLYRCGASIGGDAPGEGNLIAHGGQAGVAVGGCHGASLLGNAFVKNRGIPIDLAGSSNFDGLTPNDADDADGTEGSDPQWLYRGNRYQNRAVIDSMVHVAGGATIELTYHVDTAIEHAAYPLRIDIMRGRGGQPEALVAIDLYEAGDAQQPRVVSFPAVALQGQALILGVTDADGNSSEFESEILFSDGFEVIP